MTKPGFYLYSDDSVEKLAARFVEARKNSPDAFHPSDLFGVEEIVVPSWGMGKWLERCLVDQGVMVTNVKFSSTLAFFSRLFGQDEARSFERSGLQWRIYSILKDHPGDYPALKSYIENGDAKESCDLRTYSLAQKLAERYEGYLVECPEMLAHFSAGQTAPADNFWQSAVPNGLESYGWEWQAKLWCELSTTSGSVSPADRMLELLESTDIQKRLEEAKISRVVFWGNSTLPLRQLEILKKLATAVPVHFFCVNPCDSLWKDGVRQSWEQKQSITEPKEVVDLHENTPLRQWALHEREFFCHLAETKSLPPMSSKTTSASPAERHWQSSAVMPPPLKGRFSTAATSSKPSPHGTLQALQEKLRGRDGQSTTPFDCDDTLTIHNCHNSLRQVEILRDHILHLIDKHGYSNSEILVAAPDISVFEPFVEAVFRQPLETPATATSGSSPEAKKHLAFSIFGRTIRQANPLADAFLSILGNKHHRFELSFVEKLLNFPEIRSRFGIEEDEIPTVINWCKEAGIRWGKDGDHKQYGFPDFENFSWRHGLDRMLLGLAVDNVNTLENHWKAAAPFSSCDSTDGREQLSHIISFFEALCQVQDKIKTPCKIEEWQERLSWLMETFFQKDLDRKAYYRGLWNAINALNRQVTQSGYHGELPLEVITEALSQLIEVADEDEAFLSGAINFCNLRDIRGIPCKVLCLLGMDSGVYPRRPHRDSANLVENQINAMRRSVSFQDRYFFLESFLAAKDYVLIYYRGQNDASDKRYYPSTIVSELRSYAQNIFPDLVSKDDHIGIEVEHALLPYSNKYYSKPQGMQNGADATLRSRWSFDGNNQKLAKRINGNPMEGNAFDFGGDEAPSGDQSKRGSKGKKKEELPEIIRKQRESFRNGIALSMGEKEALRRAPIQVELKDLEEFAQNGGFSYLKHAMQMRRQATPGELLEKLEPLKLKGGLEEWGIKNQLKDWMVETVPETTSQSSGIDSALLSRFHEHLLAENGFPAQADYEEVMRNLIKSCWIGKKDLYEAWCQQTKGTERRILTLDFQNSIPLIDDCKLQDLPKNFTAAFGGIPSGGINFANVILQCSTLKQVGTTQVYLALAAESAKHKLRAYLRHLMYNAAGDRIQTVVIWKNGKTAEYDSMTQDDAKGKLRRWLALYLYGQRHAVPVLCDCSLTAASSAPLPPAAPGTPPPPPVWSKGYQGSYQDGSPLGDFTLDYATILWAQDLRDFQNQSELLRIIEELAKVLPYPPSKK